MGLYNLIIQRTTSGLNDVFISENLKGIRDTSEIERTTGDENKYATKLANQSIVYTFQDTLNYRVFSLVTTNVSDSFGRAGFYAIRLYTPKKHPSINFQALLHRINKKYLEFERDGIQRSNQDYSDLLNYELPLAENQQYNLAVKSNEQAFYLYKPDEDNLNSLFNHKAVELFDKVYAFNKEIAVSAEIIQSLGLKSFEEAKDYKEVFVNNQDGILKELKVNNNPIEFNRNNITFNMLLRNSDLIEYNTTEEPKFKQAIGLTIEIAKKYVDPPTPKHLKGPGKKSFLNEYGIYLTMLIMISVLGIASWYFVFGGEEVLKPRKKITNQKQTDSLTITFQKDSTAKDSNVFFTLYPKLEKYRFRIDNKKWSYKNIKGKNQYVEFYKTTLNDINRIDSLNFNLDRKNEFFESLKTIGGEGIPKKQVVVDKPKPDNKAIKKETPKTSTNKEIKPKPSAPKKETEEEKIKRLNKDKT